MLSRSCYTVSLLAIGILNVNAKDLDFQDLSGSGLPLGGSNYDDNLSFDDGVRGDSSSLDGLSDILGLDDTDSKGAGNFDFNDGTGGSNLDFNDGKIGQNHDFDDGYDESLEPITSTIHTTTTICPKGKNSKPTGAVPLPDSGHDFPDGTNIGNTRQDSNLGFPDGTDIGDTFSDSNPSFPGGTDTKDTFSDFSDGTKSQDSFPDSNFDFPDGTDTKNIQDTTLPIGDYILNKGDSQRVTITVTQTAPAPTGCCAQAAPPSNELGNVCKQMMAICAPYVGQGVNGFAF